MEIQIFIGNLIMWKLIQNFTKYNMSFQRASDTKCNFGFYVSHGWSISNLCSVESNTYPSPHLTASQQIFKPLTAPHLHICHFSPLLPDLITSFIGRNSLRTLLLSKIKSNSLLSSIRPHLQS